MALTLLSRLLIGRKLIFNKSVTSLSSISNKIDSQQSILDDLFINSKDNLRLLTSLTKLVNEGKINVMRLRADVRFVKICSEFTSSNNRGNDNYALVHGLRNFLLLGVPCDELENEILWKSRKMNFKLLNICLNYHTDHQETEFQKKVVKELVAAVTKRWIEISSCSDLILTLANHKLFKEEFLCKVEDRALDLVDRFDAHQLQSLLCALPSTGRRPKPLLHAIAYHLNQKEKLESFKSNVDILFALNLLNFPDVNLMQKLTNDLLGDIEKETKPKLISAIFTCTGKLKWKHNALLDACCRWLTSHVTVPLRGQDIIAPILSLARLNYCPENGQELFNLLLPKLAQIQSTLNEDVLLDVVWSLCCLGKVDEGQLRYVLAETFYKPITDSVDFRCTTRKLKLLNINSYAKIAFPLSNLYIDQLFSDWSKLTNERATSKSVLECLSNFVPRGKFMANNLKTSMGFVIDAEFLMDVNGKPVSLLEFGIKAGFDPGIKEIPDDCRRFALLVWDFKDFTLNLTGPIGVNALQIRMLKQLGYQVVEVYLDEFNNNSTAVKKVQFLQQKIKEKLK